MIIIIVKLIYRIKNLKMDKTSNETERLIKIALLAMLVGYGLSRNKGLAAIGLLAYFAGTLKNFPIKEFLQRLKEENFPNAEENDLSFEG